MFREGLEAQGMRASLAMIITQRAHSGEGNEIASADLVGTVRIPGGWGGVRWGA
jgi:ribose-phosphate pyrophosphokinase